MPLGESRLVPSDVGVEVFLFLQPLSIDVSVRAPILADLRNPLLPCWVVFMMESDETLVFMSFYINGSIRS